MIKKQPFRTTRLEEDKEEGRVTFTVSLNDKELAFIEHWKRDLDIKSNGRLLKELARVGANVLHAQFECDFLKYLARPERTRYRDFTDIDKPYQK